VQLAEKDPVHFSALLEFALQKEKEHALQFISNIICPFYRIVQRRHAAVVSVR